MELRSIISLLQIPTIIGAVCLSEPHTEAAFLSPFESGKINSLTSIKLFGDFIRNSHMIERLPSELGNYLNDPRLYQVTTEFGPSRIDLAALPVRSERVVANSKPWSSWWYPKREDWLFRDNRKEQSPLRKYDQYRRWKAESEGKPQPASAADVEANQYSTGSLAWEGLCDAWALAAVSWPEPDHPATLSPRRGKSITFTVGDLKALLLKTFEGIDDSDLKIYGQRFTGNESGWIYPDIFPEQFHRFIEVQLFEQKRAFVMDHDAGIEVWNVPVYAANYRMEPVLNSPNAVAVRLWLYHADPTSSQDPDRYNFVGTREVVREYNYVLTGERNADGTLTVTSGYWTSGPSGVNSRNDHPDYVIAVPPLKQLMRKTKNQELDIDVVDEILHAAASSSK